MSESIHSDFETINPGDERLEKRFHVVLRRMMDSPSKSIAGACRGWAETQAAYRMLSNNKVNPSVILAPHREALLNRAKNHSCIAVLQDTTELDFSSKKDLKSAGPLNSLKRRGFLAHTQFVITEDRLPLGVYDTQIFARSDEGFGKRDDTLKFEEKESYRWFKGYEQACEIAASLPDTEVFSISDREGDIHEIYNFWTQLHRAGKPHASWIVRAQHERNIVPESSGGIEPSEAEERNLVTEKLFEQAAIAKELGTIEFDIKSRQSFKKIKGSNHLTKRSSRTVKQRVRSCKVTVKPPRRKKAELEDVTFWVILAEEIDPPEGEDPIRWTLLTGKRIDNFDDAQRILKLYLARWEIEVFHRVLKTGCKVEEIQLKDSNAVQNCFVLYMIVAWRILYLTWLGRDCPQMPCDVFFEEAEWKSALAVSQHIKKEKSTKLSEPPDNHCDEVPNLGEMIKIVAELGGHLGRKNDGPPGAQVIWQGMSRVRDFALAWKVFNS